MDCREKGNKAQIIYIIYVDKLLTCIVLTGDVAHCKMLCRLLNFGAT